MKANTTKNLASVAMLMILSPFLALAIFVSVRTAGIVGNDVLLLLLTLSGAVLSGINGFGRRTGRTVALRPANADSAGGSQTHSKIQWSHRQSTNA